MPPSDNESDQQASSSKPRLVSYLIIATGLVVVAVFIALLASSVFFLQFEPGIIRLPGKLEHVIPREMEEQVTQTAYVHISREDEADLFKKLPQNVKLERYEIDVGSSMIVDLKASPSAAFTITPLTEREQLLPNIGFAFWEWDLVSHTPGDHELILSVSLVLKDEFGNKDRRTVEVFRQTVKVTVLPIHKRAIRFIREEWKWIIATVLAIIGLLIAYRQLKGPKKIGEIKSLSETVSREERAHKIGDLYARAVALRNHAASLRVLDAETESRMDELQSQLIEKMGEIAPEASINLNTLNVYDVSKHPSMALQDPKKALEFSEFLRRVMKILEDYK